VGAKINGRMMPLRTPLKNGDQVEIVTSPGQKPSPLWESFVVTGRARAHIRRFVRAEQRSQYVKLGRAILEKVFRDEGYEFADKALQGVLAQFRAEQVDDLFQQVGQGTRTGREVFEAVFPGHKRRSRGATIVPFKRRRPAGGLAEAPIPIKGLIPGMAVHYANCCHPIPGDRIVGIVTPGKGVTIHTIDCEVLQSFSDMPERWLDVSWDTSKATGETFVGRLDLVVANEPGSLGQLSSVIGKNHGNITNLRITNRSQDFFDMVVDVEVTDVRHLSDIVAALRATPQVNSVVRSRG
jgi:GTP pyrophosphokinase